MKYSELSEIFEKYPRPSRDCLIPILQDVQTQQGFLSRESVIEVGKYLKLPTSKVYGVATFYNQFSFEAQGKYHIQVCRGTACHVKGSADVLKALEFELKIEAGKTTRDKLFSLEIVACIGACGLAPVISVNGEFYAGVTAETVKEIVASYRGKEQVSDANN